jgi:hypothetical protein
MDLGLMMTCASAYAEARWNPISSQAGLGAVGFAAADIGIILCHILHIPPAINHPSLLTIRCAQ